MARKHPDPKLAQARAAKKKAAPVFGRFARVCGIGLTRRKGVYTVKVNLESEPDDDAELPEEIDGVPVVVQVMGKLRKQARAAGN